MKGVHYYVNNLNVQRLDLKASLVSGSPHAVLGSSIPSISGSYVERARRKKSKSTGVQKHWVLHSRTFEFWRDDTYNTCQSRKKLFLSELFFLRLASPPASRPTNLVWRSSSWATPCRQSQQLGFHDVVGYFKFWKLRRQSLPVQFSKFKVVLLLCWLRIVEKFLPQFRQDIKRFTRGKRCAPQCAYEKH
jgi:hypothetical protein